MLPPVIYYCVQIHSRLPKFIVVFIVFSITAVMLFKQSGLCTQGLYNCFEKKLFHCHCCFRRINNLLPLMLINRSLQGSGKVLLMMVCCDHFGIVTKLYQLMPHLFILQTAQTQSFIDVSFYMHACLFFFSFLFFSSLSLCPVF